MELITLEAGVVCTSWNDSGQRMVAGLDDGSIHVYDSDKGSRFFFSSTSKWKAQASSIVKLVWAPSEFGDLLACCAKDATISIWEEIEERDKQVTWRSCAQFIDIGVPVLDIQFGNCSSGLKLVAATMDGHVRVYETPIALELHQWHLQAEFANVADVREKMENVSCSSASICWRPPTDATQQPVFVVAFKTNSPQYGIAKIWEFGEAHQRWHIVAELTKPDCEYEQVNHVSWAPNIGRPFELLAIASSRSVSIWSLLVLGFNESSTVKQLGYFTEHKGEVWQVEWDMSGMTLASTGNDGVVRLWQANYNGKWELKGVVEGSKD